MIATLPTIVLADTMQRFELAARRTPFDVPAMKHVLVYSARLTNDPATSWIRDLFRDSFKERLSTADQLSLDKTI